MSQSVFQGPISSGYATIAGVSTTGGTTNINFGATPQPAEPVVKPFTTVPFPPDPNFVGRPAISEWVRSTLAGPGCRAALVGLGGVGKSQIAIQYAHDVRRTDPSTYVLWVYASSRARFQEAYQHIADRLKLPGRDDPQQNVLRLVWRWLSDEENGPWLMIIDNADDSSALFGGQAAGNTGLERSLASYIPKTGRGSVLVTTRSSEAAGKLVRYDCTYQVLVMEKEEAVKLLRAGLGKVRDEDSDAASNLLVALDHLPLAITQAASYIQRRSARGVTIATYLNELRENDEKRKGLLKREADDLRRDESASNAVLTTWQITFDQVRRDRASAAELLCFMSFFNPQAIPDSVLEVFSKQDVGKDLEDDIELLRDYSLITATLEDHTLEMHALVQLCTQAWLSTFDNVERWWSTFLDIMSSQYPSGKFENRTRCQELDPHIGNIIKASPLRERDAVNWAKISHRAAMYRAMNGRFSEAEAIYRRTLEARTKALGAEHPDTLASMGNLALTLQAQGKNGKAEEMGQQTLKTKMKVLGAEHPATLESMSSLALTLRAQGKNVEAEKVNQQTLEATTKALGAEHPNTLTSMNNLAATLWAQGKNLEAERMNRQTLEARTRVLGAEHPDTLMSMSNLAATLQAQGKNVEAEKIDRQTLEARTTVLGAEHPYTLTSMSNLALTLQKQGKNVEAEKMDRQTLEARTKVLGAEHPDTLTSMSNLALTLRAQGKNVEAEKMNRQTLEATMKALGAEHPDTLTSMNNLAATLQAQDKNVEAEKIDRQTLEARTRVLGAEHPSTLMSMSNLAATLQAQGKNAEAEKIDRQTLEARTRVLGAEHPSTLMSMSNLAATLQAQGKNVEAEKIDRQTLEATMKALGAEHPDTLTSMNNLAATLQAQDKNVEAEKIDRQTLEARTRVLGAEHPDTLMSMSNLAATLQAQGKNVEAEKIDRQTLEARTRVLGAEHPDTLTSMSNLAHTLQA